MKEEKKLTFSQSNPSVLKIDQPVKLDLTIKNIKLITIKIFAIDLEKQYLQTSSQINEHINLKFLVAMDERKEEYAIADPFEERNIQL